MNVLADRWDLEIQEPIDGDEVSCSWVAFARQRDGGKCVLKVGMPHFEGVQEIAGLRAWNGGAMIRMIAFDESLNAMLLERCEPGTCLRALPAEDQDEVIAGLLKRLWITPPAEIRPLSKLIEYWSASTMRHEPRSRWESVCITPGPSAPRAR